MKKSDISIIKKLLDDDFLLRDYVAIKETATKKLKVFYNEKIITISDGIGFAYLISWWCEGTITSSEASALCKLCRTYNDRF